MTGLVVLFFVFDCVIHLIAIAPVTEAFAQLGYPPGLARPIGVLELVCLVLYLIPRTSVVGAVLLTGYLGGAIATNLRAGTPLFSHLLFPIYLAIPMWGGLYARDARVREMVA
jgi:hypothetical protein